MPGRMPGSDLTLSSRPSSLSSRIPAQTRILVEPHLIDAEFRKSLDAFLQEGLGILSSLSTSFWCFVGPFLPKN